MKHYHRLQKRIHSPPPLEQPRHNTGGARLGGAGEALLLPLLHRPGGDRPLFAREQCDLLALLHERDRWPYVSCSRPGAHHRAARPESRRSIARTQRKSIRPSHANERLREHPARHRPGQIRNPVPVLIGQTAGLQTNRAPHAAGVPALEMHQHPRDAAPPLPVVTVSVHAGYEPRRGQRPVRQAETPGPPHRRHTRKTALHRETSVHHRLVRPRTQAACARQRIDFVRRTQRVQHRKRRPHPGEFVCGYPDAPNPEQMRPLRKQAVVLGKAERDLNGVIRIEAVARPSTPLRFVVHPVLEVGRSKRETRPFLRELHVGHPPRAVGFPPLDGQPGRVPVSARFKHGHRPAVAERLIELCGHVRVPSGNVRHKTRQRPVANSEALFELRMVGGALPELLVTRL